MRWLILVTALGIISESFVPSNALVGGKTSTVEEFPYIASLETKKGFVCSGAILTPYHIVTMGSCMSTRFHPDVIQVRVGSSLRAQGGIVHRVVAGKIHDEYNVFENDVGVLQLERPIEFDNKTRAAIEMVDKTDLGSVGTVAGWGSLVERGEPQDQLRIIQLKIVYKKDNKKGWIHAGSENQSMCDGDSGDPMVVGGKLAGIAASSIGCDSSPDPNVFVDVAYFRKWIDETVALLSNH